MFSETLVISSSGTQEKTDIRLFPNLWHIDISLNLRELGDMVTADLVMENEEKSINMSVSLRGGSYLGKRKEGPV